ncbi:MAG: hypothetical protein ACI8XO_000196 [Verrucomicrobiales bacterium]|jgi:hypothetical protein
MKLAAIILTLATTALLGAGLYVPEMAQLLPGALASGVLALIAQFLIKTGGAKTPAVAAATVTQQSATAVGSPKQAEAEVISFLAALQDKGRLVDFLMDDVTAYEDAQVGAAARVVHEGCRAALNEVFTIAPVTESAEGTTISVPATHRADEYRLTGKLTGQAPFNGKVVHRGWRTTSTKLPQIIVPDGELPCIAPAEVEVKA